MGDLVVPREVPSRPLQVIMEEQGHSEVGFQSLPRPVGFTWKLLYDSGSPTPLKGFVVRGAVVVVVVVVEQFTTLSAASFTRCAATCSHHGEDVGLTG